MDPVIILQAGGPLAPGSEQTLNLRVRNQGRRVEGYRLTALGPLSPHAVLTKPELSVYPGREETTDIVLTLPAGASTPTGSLPFGVLVQSLVDPEASAVGEVDVAIGGVSGLTMRALQSMRRGRWSANYAVEIANRGNTPARVCLVCHDPAGDLTFEIKHDVLEVPPGGVNVTPVKVKVRQPFLRGSAQVAPFEVACHAMPFGTEKPFPGSPARPGDDLYRQAHLQMQRLPVLTRGMMLIAGLLVLLVAALVFWSMRGGKADRELGFGVPPAPPEVRLVSVRPESLVVEWDPVAAAGTYEVRETRVDGAPVSLVGASPDSLTSSMDVTGLTPQQEYCFSVFAVAGDDTLRSAGSPPVCGTTPGVADVAAPAQLAERSRDGTRVTLTWEPPEGDITGYQVFVDGTAFGNLDGPDRPLDLGKAGSYKVYVVAQSADGQVSGRSNEITVEISAEEAGQGGGAGPGGGGGGDGPAGPALIAVALLDYIIPGSQGTTPASARQASLQQALDSGGVEGTVRSEPAGDFLRANGDPFDAGAQLIFVGPFNTVDAARSFCDQAAAAGIESQFCAATEIIDAG